MKLSLDYLEAAKVEELAAQLQAEGYTVEAEASVAASNGVARYDLIAIRPGRHIAIEVKAAPRLKEFAPELRELRRRAREQGLDEFRLVVVTPPPQRAISVAGFNERLRSHLLDQGVGLGAHGTFAPGTVVSNVSNVEINTLEWNGEENRATGTGVLDVVLNGAQTILTRAPEPLWAADFPFDFDAILDRDRRIRRCDVRVDTSSLRDEIENLSTPVAPL